MDERAAFVCIGDGELREQMEREAERLGIRGRVLFTGIRHDVDAFLSAMDVLVFPSLFEGLPLTLIEAQAAGLPCLVSEAVDQGVEVTSGLVSWKSLDETPQAWAEKAVSLVGIGNAAGGGSAPMQAHAIRQDEPAQERIRRQDGPAQGRICQRDAIVKAGYDIRALAKWYEEYLTGKAGGK